MNGKPGKKHGNTPNMQRLLIVVFCPIDTMKGSYYANPVLDEPNVSPELRQAYPEYCGKNICE